jgi:hypothetical protein
MKYLITALILVSLLMACSSFRGKGETYSGYSCQESLMHFYSHCYDKKLTKEEFDAKVKNCEKEFASNICDKEQADILWCMGRVEPGIYSQGGVICSKWFCSGSGNTTDGCDCSSFIGKLKECRMKNGIFE